ncbi:alpha/beta fold hydrolase [Patescibacteria group bacterium]|nr:alpha/beta fold hydrolase [Patescibacteria group bacterium]
MHYGRRILLVDILVIILVPLLFSTMLGIYGMIRPKQLIGVATPEHYGFDYENVSFVTEDDIRIAGWYIPRSGEPTDQAIIVLHGYPTDKGDLLARSKFLSIDYNLLLIDFRYFGQSEGKYTTLGVTETRDLRAAIHFLQDRGTKRIGVYGFSLGGAVALLAVPLVGNQIDAVVSEAAYSDLIIMIEGMYRYLGPLSRPFVWTTRMTAELLLGVDLEQVSPAEAVRESTLPILLVHSREDKVTNFENALRIQDALINNPAAEFLFFDHGNQGAASTEFAQVTRDFFIKHLSNQEN